MKKKKGKLNNLNNLLEIPKEVYTMLPKVTIIGFEEMVIENYKGILEYEEYYIKIKTHTGVLNINGYNLKLEKMTDEDIKIIGKIESMDIENFEE